MSYNEVFIWYVSADSYEMKKKDGFPAFRFLVFQFAHHATLL